MRLYMLNARPNCLTWCLGGPIRGLFQSKPILIVVQRCNAPGAVANRVALEACVKARNEGRDLAQEGNEIIREACKWSPELAAACELEMVRIWALSKANPI